MDKKKAAKAKVDDLEATMALLELNDLVLIVYKVIVLRINEWNCKYRSSPFEAWMLYNEVENDKVRLFHSFCKTDVPCCK